MIEIILTNRGGYCRSGSLNLCPPCFRQGAARMSEPVVSCTSLCCLTKVNSSSFTKRAADIKAFLGAGVRNVPWTMDMAWKLVNHVKPIGNHSPFTEFSIGRYYKPDHASRRKFIALGLPH